MSSATTKTRVHRSFTYYAVHQTKFKKSEEYSNITLHSNQKQTQDYALRTEFLNRLRRLATSSSTANSYSFSMGRWVNWTSSSSQTWHAITRLLAHHRHHLTLRQQCLGWTVLSFPQHHHSLPWLHPGPAQVPNLDLNCSLLHSDLKPDRRCVLSLPLQNQIPPATMSFPDISVRKVRKDIAAHVILFFLSCQ